MTDNPLPDPLDSAIDEIFQKLTERRDRHVENRDHRLQLAEDRRARTKEIRTEVANLLSKARNQAEEIANDHRATGESQLHDFESVLATIFADAIERERITEAELKSELLVYRLSRIAARQLAIQKGQEAYDSSVKEANANRGSAIDSLEKAEVQREIVRIELDIQSDTGRDWESPWWEFFSLTGDDFTWIKDSIAEKFATTFFDHTRANQAYNNVLDSDGGYFSAYYSWALMKLSDAIGFTALHRAVMGFDQITLRNYEGWGRVSEAVDGFSTFFGFAFSGAKLMALTKGPCGGYLFGRCFAGDTPVLIGESDWNAGHYTVAIDPEQDGPSGASVCLLVGVGAGGLLLASDPKPKRTRGSRKRVHKTGFLDDLYSEEDASLMLDDPLDENKKDFTASGRANSDVRPGALIPSDAPVQRSIDSSAAVTKVAADARVASLDSADEQNSTENGSAMNWVRRGLMCVCLMSLLMAGLLSSRTNLSDATTSSAQASVSESQTAAKRYDSVPIREIRAGGYRVLADNPETPGQAPADYGEFNRETWRVLRLQLTKPDGGWLKVSLARPLEWIKDAPRNAEGDLWLEFEELGIAHWAEVLSIEECPEDIIGDGRLVTGTFHHSAANVIQLTFSHSAETITTTANHPFWSEDRQEFVQAAELIKGEHLRLRDGTISQLVTTTRLDEEIPVYNLEVDGEHVYYVGHDGVLVHNAGKQYSVSINLGRQQTLRSMHRKTGGWSYHAWQREGLSIADPKKRKQWERAFAEATEAAENINFSLDGLDLKRAYRLGQNGPFSIPRNVTNWEFRQVLFNPKTVFFQNGKQVSLADVLKRIGDLTQ